MQEHFARRMNRVKPSAIRELLALGSDPDVISFGGGYPDPALFPVAELREAYTRALSTHSTQALQYAASDGFPRLRQQVAERLAADGIGVGIDSVLITHGAQQGLDLVAKLLIDAGDVIATEDPTFLGALISFNPYEPQYLPIPIDEEGMIVAELDAQLQAGRRVKFVYTVPDFQNPTGVTMSLSRRRQLIELADRFDFMILEDSPYREIRYEGDTIAPLKSMDAQGRVILLMSFSKMLAPGVRLGAAVASPRIVAALTLLKTASDTQSSSINMMAVSLYLEHNDLDEHIARLRSGYRRKRDIALDLIGRLFPREVSATHPEGGLFTWLTFPAGFDTARFMAERTIPEIKVAYVPGASFFPLVEQPNHARVNFSGVTDERLERGLTDLATLARDALNEADRTS